MSNKGRGEIELRVDGRSYVLRPSFETLSAIEDATDKGAAELLLSVGRSTMKLGDVVTVLWLAAKRSKNRDVPDIGKFGEKIRTELGMIKASRLMSEFLTNGVSSDKQIELAAQREEDETKDADPSQPSEEKKQDPNQPE